MNNLDTVQLGQLLIQPPEYGANESAQPPNGIDPRYLRITDIDDAGRLLYEDVRSIPLRVAEPYLLHQDDIVIARTGNTVGKSYLHDEGNGQIAFAGYLVRFQFDPHKADAKFVFRFLHSPYYYAWIERTLRTGAQPNVNAVEYKQLSLPVFRLPEQRKIARILTTVDNLIERTEALIGKYQAIKLGMMHDLFTRGVDEHGHLRPNFGEAPELYKQSELGWIPREWGVFAVGKLFNKRTERGIAGLPLMSITMTGGLVERASVDRRVESNLLPEGHLLVRKGDIAYNMMRMWQGVLGRAKYDCLVSPAYVVLQPNRHVDTSYAEYLFSTPDSIAKFKRFSQGVVDDRLRLYFHDIVRIRFAFPQSKDEQSVVAKRLKKVDATIERTITSVEKLRHTKTGLMQDLLTGKVRVKLGEEAKDV